MYANYDHEPSVLEAVGNGSYLYRYNINKVEKEVFFGEDSDTITEWECDEITVWMPLSANKILKALLTEEYGVDYENKLINDYNAALISLYDDETAATKKAKYIDFLNARAAFKIQVDKDCLNLGIK